MRWSLRPCKTTRLGLKRRTDDRFPVTGAQRDHEEDHPTWRDLKSKLADIDRAKLIGLGQDHYAANKDSQAFLHARFGLGEDVLKPYKATIDRWLWPDVFKNEGTSVAKAKKSFADYKKAVDQPEGLAGHRFDGGSR